MSTSRSSSEYKWTTQRKLKIAAALITVPLCLCAPARDWLWPQAWFVILFQIGAYFVAAAYIHRDNPSLFIERERFTRNQGTASFDKVLATIIVAITPVMYLAAGLQHRYHMATPQLSPQAQAAAALLDAFGVFLVCWAMCANHWFSSVVRIQSDRGHKVCSSGPYSCIRHPGYVGAVLQSLGEGFLLQSSWYLWLAVVRNAVFLARTAQEDGLLQKQLPGYAAYAGRAKYRWVPYMW